jgi:lipooligosaccharide transport system ATP-binding protein
VRDSDLRYDDRGHRLLIYCDARDQLYREVSGRCGRDGCTLRTATLEDVFLKLTGRELRE